MGVLVRYPVSFGHIHVSSVLNVFQGGFPLNSSVMLDLLVCVHGHMN